MFRRVLLILRARVHPLFVCVVLLTALLPGSYVMAQTPNVRFTEAEFFAVFRRFLPDDQARKEAKHFAGPEDSGAPRRALPQEGAPGSTTKLHYTTVSQDDYSDDLLALLSLGSEETRHKVEQYREWRRGGERVTEEEEREWQDRRAEVEGWFKPGAPRPRLVRPDASDE